MAGKALSLADGMKTGGESGIRLLAIYRGPMKPTTCGTLLVFVRLGNDFLLFPAYSLISPICASSLESGHSWSHPKLEIKERPWGNYPGRRPGFLVRIPYARVVNFTKHFGRPPALCRIVSLRYERHYFRFRDERSFELC
jgi:hypothetical protein